MSPSHLKVGKSSSWDLEEVSERYVMKVKELERLGVLGWLGTELGPVLGGGVFLAGYDLLLNEGREHFL